ncbi:MAG TPA: CDP-alcohol phosphatidyltransferase family protein [Gemmatimonadales bacterium]|nr:CDP-alcohol phosphatidyltransferase family protein [Gemmatimonadales bacterium]
MFDFAPGIGRFSDRVLGPLIRVGHERLGLEPRGASWSAFVASVVAAALIATGRLYAGLAFMALGQVLDGVDGGIARRYGLQSDAGRRLDEALDRTSEAAIFLAFAVTGLVSLKLVLLALIAIFLLSTVSHRSRFDPGFKRFALYFGVLLPYPLLFTVIFIANLAGFVVGMLIIDCRFQVRMDELGGDLDTVASRAAALERRGGDGTLEIGGAPDRSRERSRA